MSEIDDARLLAHYLERGAEPWNLSAEAAYLEHATRAWARPRLPARRPLAAVNVGVGVGLWDDWLGHALGRGAALTSVDVDPEVCALLAYRQRREGHPHPARVVCADVLAGTLPAAGFDLVTAIGSTVAEVGGGAAALAALARLVAPGGRLLIEIPGQTDPARLAAAVTAAGLAVVDARVDRHLSDLALVQVAADRPA